MTTYDSNIHDTTRIQRLSFHLGRMASVLTNKENYKPHSPVFGFIGKTVGAGLGAAGAIAYYGEQAKEVVSDAFVETLSNPAITDVLEATTFAPELQQFTSSVTTGHLDTVALVSLGVAGAFVGAKAGGYALAKTADAIKFGIGSSISMSFGMLKKGYGTMKNFFENNRSNMVPVAVQMVQDDMDYLDVALTYYQNDEMLVASLQTMESLSASEFATLRKSYAHLIETSESKVVSSTEDLAVVFKETSFGKVSKIFSDGKVNYLNEKIADKTGSMPSWDDLIEQTNNRVIDKIYESLASDEMTREEVDKNAYAFYVDAVTDILKDSNIDPKKSENIIKRAVFESAVSVKDELCDILHDNAGPKQTETSPKNG